MEDYTHAKHVLESAITRAGLEPTLHEGLFVACVDFLSWLDAEHDLPETVAGDYKAWCAGLIPDARGDEAYGRVLTAVRMLDAQHIKDKLRQLRSIAASLG